MPNFFQRKQIDCTPNQLCINQPTGTNGISTCLYVILLPSAMVLMVCELACVQTTYQQKSTTMCLIIRWQVAWIKRRYMVAMVCQLAYTCMRRSPTKCHVLDNRTNQQPVHKLCTKWVHQPLPTAPSVWRSAPSAWHSAAACGTPSMCAPSMCAQSICSPSVCAPSAWCIAAASGAAAYSNFTVRCKPTAGRWLWGWERRWSLCWL